MKKFILMILLALFFSSASFCFAVDKLYWITKIDSDMITVSDDKGKEKMFAGMTTDLNVGDTVIIKEGMVVKSKKQVTRPKKKNLLIPR